MLEREFALKHCADDPLFQLVVAWPRDGVVSGALRIVAEGFRCELRDVFVVVCCCSVCSREIMCSAPWFVHQFSKSRT